MYVAVYGSLRTDSYNYERIQHIFPGNFEMLKTSMLPGFKMYDLGFYPAIVPSDNQEDEVYVEIMECGKEAFEYIQDMEHGAGYKEKKIIIDGYNCTVFYMDNVPYRAKQIIKGDYIKYCDTEKV